MHTASLCYSVSCVTYFFFSSNDPATTEIYTLSLHDALPISLERLQELRDPAALRAWLMRTAVRLVYRRSRRSALLRRSEEHTSELQSPDHLVCRLLLEKKKKKQSQANTSKTACDQKH